MKNVMKKNQFVILVIALMLVTAGYLNYTTNNTENSIEASANVNETNLGDATLVNSQEITSNNIAENNAIVPNNEIAENTITTSNSIVEEEDDYFVSSKLQRDTMYSQMIESYQRILESSTISTEQKAIATEEINNINNTKNAIMICENLIQTKGFSECVIFVNDESISIVIKAEELTNEQIAQIQNIVAREMKAEIENIHISNK